MRYSYPTFTQPTLVVRKHPVGIFFLGLRCVRAHPPPPLGRPFLACGNPDFLPCYFYCLHGVLLLFSTLFRFFFFTSLNQGRVRARPRIHLVGSCSRVESLTPDLPPCFFCCLHFCFLFFFTFFFRCSGCSFPFHFFVRLNCLFYCLFSFFRWCYLFFCFVRKVRGPCEDGAQGA